MPQHSETPRVVAHLDMDAFYASVELLRYPELRGQAVVIGGSALHRPIDEIDAATGARRRRYARLRDYVGRGVITTATYEARALGVNSAMGLMKAAASAPDAILLPGDFDQYRRYSRLFKDAVRAIAPQVEDRGIDEIYIELTDLVAERLPPLDDTEDARHRAAEAWWSAREIAIELKQSVLAATGLTCSVGLAPNKLVAKIASELDKPDGLSIFNGNDIAGRLAPLAVRRLHGVGPKAAARLARLGIATIGELAAADVHWLTQHFGATQAAWMHAASHGIDDRPVVTVSEPKSMSRETTFERDLHAVRDRTELGTVFSALCAEVAADLQRKRYLGRSIGVKLRFDDFKTVTRDHTIATPTDDAAVIRRAAGLCLKRLEFTRRIRLLGVRVGGLSIAEADRADMFDERNSPVTQR